MITLLVVYTERRLIAYPQFFTGGVPLELFSVVPMFVLILSLVGCQMAETSTAWPAMAHIVWCIIA